MDDQQLKNTLEAILMSAGKPLSPEKLVKMFTDEPRPSITQVKKQLAELVADCEGRGIELVQVGSGFRYQGRQEYGPWVSKLWEVKPQRYSRALLETLALIAYRQPVTRGDIEEVRGVSVSSSIMKTLLEREWVHVVGHRDVPGRPAMYATTKAFLDYFNIQSLEQLPTLSEIKDLAELEPELDLENKRAEAQNDDTDELPDNATNAPSAEAIDDEVVETPSNESIH